MGKAVRRIEESVGKMEVLACRLSTLFTVLLVVNGVLFVGCLSLEIIHRMTVGIDSLNFTGRLSLVSLFLEFFIYEMILFVMRGIALDVAKRKSPFVPDHARKIKIIAWLYVAAFIVGVLVSPDFTSLVQASVVNLGVISDQGANPSMFFLDIKSCFGAIVSFALSSLWQYGALLQTEADDYL